MIPGMPHATIGMPQAGCMARILGPETRAGAWFLPPQP